jgi:hypothetical protein
VKPLPSPLLAVFALVLTGGLLAGGCGSSPPIDNPVWLTWEGRTPAFQRDREYIQSRCDLLRKEEEPRQSLREDDLRASAASFGANAIVVERTGDGTQDRTTFYRCASLPSSVAHGPLGPAH